MKPVHAWTRYAREPGDLSGIHWSHKPLDRLGTVCGRNSGMNAVETSDINILPKKAPNNKVG